MRRNSKDVLVLCMTIVAILSIVFAVNTMIKAEKVRRAFEKEMAYRLDSEERLTRLRAEKLNMTNTIKDQKDLLDKQQEKVALLEENLAGQDKELKRAQEDLRTMAMLKDRIEQNLKEELAKQVQR